MSDKVHCSHYFSDDVIISPPRLTRPVLWSGPSVGRDPEADGRRMERPGPPIIRGVTVCRMGGPEVVTTLSHLHRVTALEIHFDFLRPATGHSFSNLFHAKSESCLLTLHTSTSIRIVWSLNRY